LYNLAEAEIIIVICAKVDGLKMPTRCHETQGPAIRENLLAMYWCYTFVAMGVNTCGVLSGMTHVYMKKD
jgi:hypothetical protein